VEGFNPSLADKHHAELLERLDALRRELAALRAQPASE
jgi:ribosomal protein L29